MDILQYVLWFIIILASLILILILSRPIFILQRGPNNVILDKIKWGRMLLIALLLALIIITVVVGFDLSKKKKSEVKPYNVLNTNTSDTNIPKVGSSKRNFKFH